MNNFTDILLSFGQNFTDILLDMSPFLLLGFFIAGLLKVFVPSHLIYRFFGKNKFGSSLNAALIGVPLPLCSCGVIPTGLSLYRNGASKGSTLSFLISTPHTGIDSILVAYSLLGLPFAIIRPIVAFITGVLGGYLGNIIEPYNFNWKDEPISCQEKTTFTQKIIEVFKYGFIDFMKDISKWLLIGLLLAALISAIVPDNFFGTYNIPIIWQMVCVLILSIPMYVCATASVPLVAVLILKGLSPGAALVLLMAGPSTNMASLTVVGKVMGKKSLLVLLSSLIISSFIFGFVIDYILPSEWFIIHKHSHNHIHSLSGWLQIISGIILMLLILYSLISKYFIKQKTEDNMKTEKFEIQGLACTHCKHNVESNLKKLGFVDNVRINMSTNELEVEGDNIDEKVIAETITSLGYKFIGKK